MLNNLRRKRVQRIDIDEWQYFNRRSDIWWKGVVVGYRNINMTISKQRYSKEKLEQSFDVNLDIAKKLGITRDYVISMILCPRGAFEKGHEQQKDNKPKVIKIKKAFLLGETEITQEIYESVMGVNPSKYKDNPKNPVEMVSWYDALTFCNKLSDMFKLDRYYTITENGEILDTIRKDQYYQVEMNENAKGFRLPTEWEWEYVAKPLGSLYLWTVDADDVGWHSGNSGGTTHSVKQKKPNARGFYDMLGNVSEWCENTYKDNDADISGFRVFRGGNFCLNKFDLNPIVHRARNVPIHRGYNLGFRVCKYI